MADRGPETAHAEDLPSSDSPADSALLFGMDEPDPAEVVGDDGEEVDVSHAGVREPDAYHRDTLDERLAEERPDVLDASQNAEAGDLQSPEPGSEHLFSVRAEPDRGEPGDGEAEAAEDAAVHVRDPRNI
jgi:hypothetical protein